MEKKDSESGAEQWVAKPYEHGTARRGWCVITTSGSVVVDHVEDEQTAKLIASAPQLLNRVKALEAINTALNLEAKDLQNRIEALEQERDD